MKTLYFECNMGAAGDMLMAALLELLPGPDAFIKKLNGLGIPNVWVEKESSVKCGVTGTHISVRIGGKSEEGQTPDVSADHSHTDGDGGAAHERSCPSSHTHDGCPDMAENMTEIQSILHALPIPNKVKANALAVYQLIAEAESKAHGRPVNAVHFHEVGMMDAIADIVGVCLLIDELSPQRIVASPVHVGSGQVQCSHGILPVPAPATAHILKGVPTYGGQIRGELCTPTGAALLKHFADEFGDRPLMITEGIGYGMGKKDFPTANCVRAFIGESSPQRADIVELACNLDDMTGEELGFALEVLLENGALDVCIAPVQMKKSRPGHMLLCLCRPEDEENMAALMLKHTSTFGVRSSKWRRYTLERSTATVDTAYGRVCIKTGKGFGLTKSKIEYEDLARLARLNGTTIAAIRAKLIRD